MDWGALKAGFRDELSKIGEVNLHGLSSETILNYPAPEPMPSAAYEKAQAILQKAQRYQSVAPPPQEEKTAGSPRPDVLPQLNRLLNKHMKKEDEPPPGKIDKAKSLAGHTLAGAGAAKFIHGAVETGVQTRRTGVQRFYKLDPKWQAGALAAGAAMGAGEYFRKQHRKRKWQDRIKGRTKTASPFPMVPKPTGPTFKTLAPAIGRRGTLPKIGGQG